MAPNERCLEGHDVACLVWVGLGNESNERVMHSYSWVRIPASPRQELGNMHFASNMVVDLSVKARER